MENRGFFVEVIDALIKLFLSLRKLLPLSLIAFVVWLVYNATKPEEQRWKEAHKNWKEKLQSPALAKPESPNPVIEEVRSRWNKWYEYEEAPNPHARPRSFSYGSREVKNFSISNSQWQDTGIIVVSGDLLVFRGDTNYLEYKVGESDGFLVGNFRVRLYEINPGDRWFSQKGNLLIRTRDLAQNVTIEHYSYRSDKSSLLYRKESTYKKDDYTEFERPPKKVEQWALEEGLLCNNYPLVCKTIIFEKTIVTEWREEKFLVDGIYVGIIWEKDKITFILFPKSEGFLSTTEWLDYLYLNEKWLITRKINSQIYQAMFIFLGKEENGAKFEIILRK